MNDYNYNVYMGAKFKAEMDSIMAQMWLDIESQLLFGTPGPHKSPKIIAVEHLCVHWGYVAQHLGSANTHGSKSVSITLVNQGRESLDELESLLSDIGYKVIIGEQRIDSLKNHRNTITINW